MHWHRLLFDPVPGKQNFESSEEFSLWCQRHFSDFEYRDAGFMTPLWNHAVNHPGMKLRMIIIPGQSEYQTGALEIMRFLSEKHWRIDGFDAIMYLKHAAGENEILFPIRGGRIDV